ncbi:MAG TPA: hypothetical protein PL126_00600 [Candidatus Cloacimonadota bacterium]|nr:hypothetical protein [Candidatus Cloacimonadota bacterium]
MKNLPLFVIALLLLGLSTTEFGLSNLWQGVYCVQIAKADAVTPTSTLKHTAVVRDAKTPMLPQSQAQLCKK